MTEFARITNGVYIQTTAQEYPATWPAEDQVPVRGGPWQEWDGEKWVGEPPAPSTEDIQRQFSDAIQAHLDATARERQYDGMQTAVSYRGDPNPQFAAEAEALFNWRSDVWTCGLAELEAVLNGQRPIPTVEDMIDELPKFTWPET